MNHSCKSSFSLSPSIINKVWGAAGEEADSVTTSIFSFTDFGTIMISSSEETGSSTLSFLGSSTINLAPLFSSLSTRIVQSCSSTKCFTKESPIPSPVENISVFSIWKKRSNITS